MGTLNLQALYNDLKKHYSDFGYNGGLGTSLEWFINDLVELGYSKSLIKKIMLKAYYNN